MEEELSTSDSEAWKALFPLLPRENLYQSPMTYTSKRYLQLPEKQWFAPSFSKTGHRFLKLQSTFGRWVFVWRRNQDIKFKIVKTPSLPPKAVFVWKSHKGASFLTGVQATARLQWMEPGQCALIKGIHNPEIPTQINRESLREVWGFEMTRSSTFMPHLTKTPWWLHRGLNI